MGINCYINVVLDSNNRNSTCEYPDVSDVKFVASSESFAAGDSAKTKAANQFTWSYKTATEELSFGTVYVALRGSATLVVDSTHMATYALSLAAIHTLAA